MAGLYFEALEYAANGYSVFPLKGKVPYTANGFKDAVTIDENDGQSATDAEHQIHAWWERWPNANIGMVVPDKLVILDFDPRNGATVESLGDLPPTYSVLSGRGDGGMHRYYMRPALPEGCTFTKTRLPEGVDLQAAGKYVVVPPSIHPATGQPYIAIPLPVVSLPERVIEMIIRRPVPKTPFSLFDYSARSPWDLFGGGKADGAGLVTSVAEAPEGKRNDVLYWATCAARDDGLLPELAEQLVEAAMSAGLSEFEVRRTIASAERSE